MKGKDEERGEEVNGGIWPTQKFWRGAPYEIKDCNYEDKEAHSKLKQLDVAVVTS